MNETQTTVRGTIITNPTLRRAGDTPVLGFRVASNTRYLDRESGEWRTGGTLYLSVTAWGRLATRGAGVLVKGDSVIVQGRIVTQEYEKDGVPRSDLEMRVGALGVDLSRMDVTVSRPRDEQDGAQDATGGGSSGGDRAELGSFAAAGPESSTEGERAPAASGTERELVGAGTADTPPF